MSPKDKAGSKAQDAVANEPTTTVSMRVTAEEKLIIEHAATLRGWSPAKLMRTAAVERAVNIINIEEERFDFEGLCQKVAAQLVRPSFEIVGGDSSASHFAQPRVYLMGTEEQVHRDASAQTDGRKLRIQESLFLISRNHVDERTFELVAEVSALEESTSRTLQTAAVLGGSEFAVMLAKRLSAWIGPAEAPPPIDPSKLGGDNVD
ncbi:MAG: hypothetical protein NW201_14375 [Gemmatimonadales bacterium]|nr:hypothetical protein [Gemmatimonadales bacterium]